MNAESLGDITCPNCGTEWELTKEEASRSQFTCEECKAVFNPQHLPGINLPGVVSKKSAKKSSAAEVISVSIGIIIGFFIWKAWNEDNRKAEIGKYQEEAEARSRDAKTREAAELMAEWETLKHDITRAEISGDHLALRSLRAKALDVFDRADDLKRGKAGFTTQSYTPPKLISPSPTPSTADRLAALNRTFIDLDTEYHTLIARRANLDNRLLVPNYSEQLADFNRDAAEYTRRVEQARAEKKRLEQESKQ